MPKKSLFTSKGKSFLKGKKTTLTKRRTITAYKETPELVRLPGGSTLNIPESKVYRALEKMKENFSAQVPFGGGRVLGGSLADFVLWDRRLILEYQGYFHNTAEGRAKDFWRKVRREQAGFMVVYLYEKDLLNIHRRLAEIMGSPGRASITSGGSML